MLKIEPKRAAIRIIGLRRLIAKHDFIFVSIKSFATRAHTTIGPEVEVVPLTIGYTFK